MPETGPTEQPSYRPRHDPVRERKVDIGLALEQGWDALTRNLAMSIVFTLVHGFVTMLFAVTIIGLLFVPALAAGYWKAMLKGYRGERIEFGDLFAEFDRTLSYLGLALLQFLLTLIGLILLIIPGLLVPVFLYLAYPLMVDKGLGANEAVARSFSMCWKYFLQVLGVMILLFGINMLASMIPFAPLLTAPLAIYVIFALYFQILDEDPTPEQRPAGDMPPPPGERGSGAGSRARERGGQYASGDRPGEPDPGAGGQGDRFSEEDFD